MHHNNDNAARFKYLALLTMLYIVTICASIVLAYRMTTIMHITFSASIFIFPLSYLCNDIITEVYGYAIARQVIWYGVVTMIIFGLLCQIPLLLPTHNLALSHAYHAVVDPFFRVTLSGSASAIVGDFVNIYALSKWKVLLNGRLFWIRSVGSTSIGEIANTIVNYLILLGGIVSWAVMMKIICAAYLIKLLYTLISVPLCALIVRYLKKAEDSDVYDVGTNFNPFKLSMK